MQDIPGYVDGHQVNSAVSEVLQEFTNMKLSATDRDFVVRGMLPYMFKGRQYNTPVKLFRSHRPRVGEECFRCLLDLDEAEHLMVSSKALYVEPVSGAVRVTPPASPEEHFLNFVKRVQRTFGTAPPLVQRVVASQSATATTAATTAAAAAGGTGASTTQPIVSRTTASTNIPFDEYVLNAVRDAAVFHNGALNFNSSTTKFTGVIPITYKGRPFAIPVEVKLHPELFTSQPPMMFVTPTDTMALVPNEFVSVGTGLVQTPCMSRRPPPSFLEILREAQMVFTSKPPVCRAPAGYQSPSGRMGNQPNEPPSTVQVPQPEPLSAASVQPQPINSVSLPSERRPMPPPDSERRSEVDPEGPPPSMVTEATTEQRLCVICLENTPQCVFLPCRHMCVCRGCSVSLTLAGSKCPMCRGPIESVLEVYT